MTDEAALKPLVWVGSSRRDFVGFPEAVKSDMGYGLFVAQNGGLHRKAKPLKGSIGAGVVEIVADHRGDTFRSVYTVRFSTAVYVLHVFQKKSKSGIATPLAEIRLIQQRLKQAEALHGKWNNDRSN